MKTTAIVLVLLVALFTAHPAVAATEPEPGTLIVLNKDEASASILDLATGEEIAKLPTGVGPHEVAVAGDMRTAVVADYGKEEPGNTLTVIDLATLEVVRTIDLGKHTRPHGILFLRDGRHVIVTTEGSEHLLEVDVLAGEITRAMPTGGQLGHMVAITPDERWAYVPHMRSDDVAVIDLHAGERVALLELQSQPEGIDTHPSGEEVWITNRGSDTISIVDTDDHEVIETIPCGSFPIRLKFTHDGRHALVSNARTGDVAVFDAETREEIHRVPMLAETVAGIDERLFGDQFDDSPVPVGILVHPHGDRAFVANTNADVVSVIDLESFEVVDRLVGGKEPDGLAHSPLAPSRAGGLAHEGLMATLWAQEAAEFDALTRGVYNAATRALDALLADRSMSASLEQLEAGDYQDLPPAVILDVDETVLDNVAYQARLILDEDEYGPETWTAWCEERAAVPVPGALEFCRAADARGVAVFYVTNRRANVDEATTDNLRRQGFPLSDDEDRVLTRGEREGWTGDKTSRRAFVAERYRVVAMFGDNLGDFVDIEELGSEERDARVTAHADWWGQRWFVLPNPMYGSWDGTLIDGDWGASRAEKLQRKRAWLEPLRD